MLPSIHYGIGMSGGQSQRVAIAPAPLKRPRILVFDESTRGLDETSARHSTITFGDAGFDDKESEL